MARELVHAGLGGCIGVRLHRGYVDGVNGANIDHSGGVLGGAVGFEHRA